MAFGMRLTWAIQPPQDLAPLVGDRHFDDAAILAAADARHQTAPVQTVDQPRDVGVARDHALGDLAARPAGSDGCRAGCAARCTGWSSGRRWP